MTSLDGPFLFPTIPLVTFYSSQSDFLLLFCLFFFICTLFVRIVGWPIYSAQLPFANNYFVTNYFYETRLQRIMVAVLFKTNFQSQDIEYNYHDSLQACLIEGIGHFR